MSQALLFLDREDVEALLPMEECIEVIDEALRILARGEAVQPLRTVYWMPDRHGLLAVMPGLLGGPVAGAKGVTGVPENHQHGLESHQGMVVLFEQERGRLLAILDAASVTAIRTAAASGVATRALARRDAGDLAILGSGVQARTHLDAMRAVRPLRRVRVWSRRPESARRFAAEETERTGLSVEAASTAREAVAGADLICAVTAATEAGPPGGLVAPGGPHHAAGGRPPEG